VTELVINSPSLQSLQQRYISTILTFVFWVLWIFLWTPLLTLLAWLVGAHLVYFEMFELKGWGEVVREFKIFSICVTLIGLALGLWALYNYQRFHGVERRKAFPPLENNQLAEFFQVDATELSLQQKAQCLTVTFDEHGHITDCSEIVFGISLR
jgi:biofilm PGA synthesis protein PgaD